MKKYISLAFAALLLVAGFSIESSAQTKRNRHNMNHRQTHQQTRIYRGIRNGSLNRREASRLERQQYRISRTEARYRRSGNGLSLRERRNLQHRLNHSSRSIYRQKHDKQTYGYPRRRL